MIKKRLIKRSGEAEICTIIMGQSPPSSFYNAKGDGLPFFQGKKDFGALYPTPSVWCNSPTKIAEKNDILISVRAPVGPVNFCKVRSAIGRGLAALRANGRNLDCRFLYHFLKSIEDKWDTPLGAVFSAITKVDLQNLEIPLPPLEEQKMIVEKIEKLFAKIEEAERLRRAALADSAALIPSTLHRVFSRAEKEGWEEKELGEICDILDSQRKPVTKRDRKPGPYPYYGATGVQDYVADYIFDEPLVLVGEDGAKWGIGEKTAYRVEGKCWVNNHAHVLRPHRNKVLDGLIEYFLNIIDISEYITGLTVKKLNQAKLRGIKIPLPSIDEQKKIVAYLDRVSEKARSLVETQKAQLADLVALRQSILHQAFQGEL